MRIDRVSRLARQRAAVIMTVVLAACSEGATAPEGFRGVTDGRITALAGRPYGVRLGATGVGYVLQFASTSATRFAAGGGVQGAVALGTDPIDVVFTTAGDLAYFTTYDGDRVFVVNTQTNAVVDTFAVGARHHRIVMAPDQSRLWVTTIDGRVLAIDRASGAPLGSATTGLVNVRAISRHPTTGTLVVSGDFGLRLLDGTTLDSLTGWTGLGQPQDIVHSTDGSRVFVAFESGVVRVYDGISLSATGQITFGSAAVHPFGMALSPDGATLVVSSATPAFIATVDARTLVVRNVIAPGGMPRRVAFSADGSRAYVANESGWVDVIR